MVISGSKIEVEAGQANTPNRVPVLDASHGHVGRQGAMEARTQ